MSAMALVIDDFAKYRISSIQIYSTFFWYHYSKCVFIRQLTNVCNVFASLLYNRIDERARKATPFHAVQFRATHTNMEKENGRTRHIRCSRTSNERTWALPIEPASQAAAIHPFDFNVWKNYIAQKALNLFISTQFIYFIAVDNKNGGYSLYCLCHWHCRCSRNLYTLNRTHKHTRSLTATRAIQAPSNLRV